MAVAPKVICIAAVLVGSAVHGHGYSYSAVGQDKWGGVCASGKLQSPIAIDISKSLKPTAETAEQLLYTRLTEGDYKVELGASEKTEIENNGYTLKATPKGAGSFGTFKLPSGTFKASEFHFRFPAEHKLIDDSSKSAPAMAGELQIMFENAAKDKFVGLAVLLNAVPTEKLMQPRHKDFFEALGFKPNTKDMANLGNSLPTKAGDSIALGKKIDLAASIMPDIRSNYFHYTGSLTSPPCTEDVPWYVVKIPVNVTWLMLQTAKDAILQAGMVQASGNNRLLQSSHGRSVMEDALVTDRYDHVLGSMALTTSTKPPPTTSTVAHIAAKAAAAASITSTSVLPTTITTTITTTLDLYSASSSGSSVEGPLPAFFYQPSSGRSSSASSVHLPRLAVLSVLLGAFCCLILSAGIVAVLCSRRKKKLKRRPKEELEEELSDLEDYESLNQTHAITVAAPSSSYYARPAM